jgi:hypothetical protein
LFYLALNLFVGVQVSGYVRSADTAGKLPVKEAIVEYSFSVEGKDYRGSTLTDADGFYNLTILVCAELNLVADMSEKQVICRKLV